MALRGNKNRGSVSLVSGSQSTGTAPSLEELNLAITVPDDNPYTNRVARVEFNWFDENGLSVDVQGFDVADIITTGLGTLSNFMVVNAGHYEVDVTFPNNQTGLVVLAVNPDTAELVSDPTITGPSSAVIASIYFDTTAQNTTVRITPSNRNSTSVGLLFEWVSISNEPINVTDFEQVDIETTLGTISGFEGDGDTYRATLDVTANTNTEVTITVREGDAVDANGRGAPFEDVEETFTVNNTALSTDITDADEVCVLERDINANEFLNDVLSYYMGANAGGAFNAPLESADIGDFHYFVVNIEKHLQTVDDMGDLTNEPFIDTALQSGAALIRVDMSNCTHTLIKAYKDVTTAARSLKVNGTDLYWIEGSHYMYHEDAIFHSESDKTELSVDWKQMVGNVYKLASTSVMPEWLGINWRSATTEDNPDEDQIDRFYGRHGGSSSPILFVGDEMQFISGYGDFEGILRHDEDKPVNDINNWNLIRRSTIIQKRIPELITNGKTGYEVLREVAIITDSIIGFQLERFVINPRDYRSAKVTNTISSGELRPYSDVLIKDTNWNTYPDSGVMLIGDELIRYNGQTDTSRTEIRRAINGTSQSQHDPDDEIIFIDHVISLNHNSSVIPINDLSLGNDYRQHYNRIDVTYGDDRKLPPVKDDNSISVHGEKILEISLELDNHQKVVAQFIAERILGRFKDVRQTLDLTLKISPYIEVGDIIYLIVPNRLHLQRPCKVLQVSHMLQAKETEVKLVTIN